MIRDATLHVVSYGVVVYETHDTDDTYSLSFEIVVKGERAPDMHLEP